MPTQTTDIFALVGPAITYAAPGLTWKIAKDVTVSSGDTVAIYSEFGGSKLVNKGVVYSDSSAGAYLTVGNTQVLNKKGAEITGVHGLAVGRLDVENIKVDNAGKIIGEGLYGVIAQDISNFQLHNTGEIFGSSIGVYVQTVSPLTQGAKIDNAGLIHSSDYYGIVNVVTGNPNLKTKIVNREDGVIEGDVGAIYNVSGMIRVKNEGKIKGDILSTAADAEDNVVNKGKIKGDTHLGSGDDIFKNKDGKAKMLFGEEGNDTFFGGASKDKIVFDTALNALTNVDTVKGFEAGKDQFYLDQTIFASLTGPGPLLASEFRKGNAAVDGDDFIVYHKGSGSLFYDPDGSGGAAQVKFAQVDKGTKLSHDDFMVIA